MGISCAGCSDRAAAAAGAERYDYIRNEVANRLVDRLADIRGRRFERVLDVGSHHGPLLPGLSDGAFGVREIVQLDSSREMLARAAASDAGAHEMAVTQLLADEEQLLAQQELQESSFDAVLSSMALHWVNDLPGVLIQSRMLLKPDGVFLAAMLGGDTLKELRSVLASCEQKLHGGAIEAARNLASLTPAEQHAFPCQVKVSGSLRWSALTTQDLCSAVLASPC
eukprot:SAG31_NODE_2245_length_6101_cov_1.381539_1_plen_225_part_00